MLPFTREQFIANFATYNEAVSPAQLVAYAMGVGMAALVLFPSPRKSRFVGIGLAAMWTWTGMAYHGMFFSRINGLAWGFAVLFVAQGLLCFHAATARPGIEFGHAPRWRAVPGWLLIAYALVGYPLMGHWLGHRYPQLPMFGITPCPVTLFTFGLLLLSTRPVSPWLVAIPFAWSLVGGSAAFLLGMPQDWPLLGGVAVLVLVYQSRRTARMSPVAAFK